MKYDIDAYTKYIDHLISNVDKVGPGIFIAVKSIQSEQAERIFEKGISSDGSKIGDYNSTNPIYINSDKSPKKFKPEGKPKATTTDKKKTKASNDKRKTKYFESYRAFRQQIGRESGFVNLRLFGRLQSDFVNAPVQSSQFSYDVVLNSLNAAKAKGNEAHFGKKIFGLTKEENQTFLKVLGFELNKILFIK